MVNKIQKVNTTYAERLYTPGLISYDSTAEEIRLGKILKLVGKNNKILDIGCYDGSLGKRLIDNNNEVYGIEVNKESAELAHKRGLKVRIQDVTEVFDFENDFLINFSILI